MSISARLVLSQVRLPGFATSALLLDLLRPKDQRGSYGCLIKACLSQPCFEGNNRSNLFFPRYRDRGDNRFQRSCLHGHTSSGALRRPRSGTNYFARLSTWCVYQFRQEGLELKGGGCGRDRTCAPSGKNRELFQLSYTPRNLNEIGAIDGTRTHACSDHNRELYRLSYERQTTK